MRGKTFRIFRWQHPLLHVLAHNHMHGLALAQQHAVLYPQYLVAKPNHRSTYRLQRCLHHQFIVIPRRSTIPYMHIYHRNPAALGLHLLVVQAHAADQLHSANLEPHQVVRVIHHAHLIGLGIPHPPPSLAYTLPRHNFTHPNSLPNTTSSEPLPPHRLPLLQKRPPAFAASAAAVPPSNNALFSPASSRFVAASDCGLFAINATASSRVRATSN